VSEPGAVATGSRIKIAFDPVTTAPGSDTFFKIAAASGRTPKMTLTPGTRLGRYEIRSKIGSGGLRSQTAQDRSQYREEKPNSTTKLALIPFEGGQPIKLFDLSATADYENLHWSPDGQALLYIDTKGGVSNIWSQPIDGSPAKQVTNFKSDLIFDFDWSHDGKQLAVSRGNQPSDVVLISGFK